MVFRFVRLAGFIALIGLLWGCATSRPTVTTELPPPDLSWTQRAITAEEIEALGASEPALSRRACEDILARLNTEDRRYVKEDIDKGNSLKVPNDFRSYVGWSPLPTYIGAAAQMPKFILVVKDIPFLGWYSNGKLVSDAPVGIGKRREWTKTGRYNVMEKDLDHVSRSYRSAYGYPALMPYAIRVYGHVWIHGGDVVSGYCSHGCINLPLGLAEALFNWSEHGTTVLIADSLNSLDSALQTVNTRPTPSPSGRKRLNKKASGRPSSKAPAPKKAPAAAKAPATSTPPTPAETPPPSTPAETPANAKPDVTDESTNQE